MKGKHEILVREATELLKSKGITKISYETTLPNRTKLDVLAFDNNNKIAVECMVQVQPKWVTKKIKAYSSYVDKLIFLVPASEVHKLKDFSEIDEVWESKALVISGKNILIKNVPDDLYYRLVALKAKLGCDSWLKFLKAVEWHLRVEEEEE